MELTLDYFRLFLDALRDPEYAFLFLEPLLIYGVAFGLLAFLFGVLTREPKTQLFGLVCIVGSCLAVAPYLNHRQASEDRIVSVYRLSQPDRAYGFTYNNEDRARKQWFYFITAAFATLTILFGQSETRSRVFLSLATCVFCVVTILYGCFAHFEESKVYHPNLRQELRPPEEPPPTQAGIR